MNDVQQFVVKPHSQSIEQQYQATSECWNLVVDEGLLQVYIYTYTYTYISRTSRIIILYNEIKDVKEKYQFTKELNEFEAEKVVCSMVKLSVTKVDATRLFCICAYYI